MLHEGGAVHRTIPRKDIVASAHFGMAQGDERADEFAQRVTRAGGDELKAFPQQRSDLFVGQPEIEHGQRRIKFFVVILRHAVFLHAEFDVLVMELEVGLDEPVMSIVTQPLKEEGVRPGTPTLRIIEMTLRAVDGFVDQRQSAGEPDATGPGVTFEELAVRNAGDADGFVLNRILCHTGDREQSRNAPSRRKLFLQVYKNQGMELQEMKGTKIILF